MKPAAKSIPQTRRRPSAKPPQKSGGTPGETGKLTAAETRALILQATDAYNYQLALGNIEPGQAFDDWRRDRVMDAVELPGISKINRCHWRTVMAEFLQLAGRDDEAFGMRQRTGVKTYRPTDQGDTWETSETYVAAIRKALDDHSRAVVSDPKGHIHTGWFLTAARQRTGKPSLTMDTLAERVDPNALHGLLSHLRNHISLREGRANLERRSARSYPKPADPGDMSDPF
jgi:hypothetical protein